MRIGRFSVNWLTIFLLLTAAAIWLAPRCSNDWQIRHRQQIFLSALEQRNQRDLDGLISPDYADEWKFDAAALRLACGDVSAQFLTLHIRPQNPSTQRHGDSATWQAVLRLEGRALTPAGDPILRRAAELQKPFVFTWRKQSFWPWSWRLVNISQDEFESDTGGYTPGMLSEIR